ncbi:BglG family transcription antiterminator [Robertmurraya kyonggiensis]|uniref:Transcription antiterminator n=1 Tax=Robertmurraya kyonggiensis TaxID=1037680 RepID=A0A4U1D7G1_9BACI|nr:BglG family transcription antiterminator [Robertmurraya kyonggiensis]TKC18535.1 transcription antiterminator [Robertmurraya kyonggiensis]
MNKGKHTLNKRQNEILALLLKNNKNENIKISTIAETLHCSEKTVRNDFKTIDEWLEHDYQAKIIRKPNIGVKLEISNDEHERLLEDHHNQQNRHNKTFEKERKKEILFMLLRDNKTLSLQELCEQYYVSKQVIKQDLHEIEQWIKLFHLSIESKQKIGLKVIGNEKNKRAALLRLHQFTQEKDKLSFFEKWFSHFEITRTKQQLRKMESQLHKTFTNESMNNLVLHLLVMVKRIKLKQTIQLSLNEQTALKSTKEYGVVQNHLKELESSFVIKFPDEEIIYFLLHIISSKEKGKPDFEKNILSPKVTTLIQVMIKKVSEQTGIQHEADQTLVEGLMIHMKTTYERLEYRLYHRNPLLDDIKRMYSYTFDTIFHITKEMENEIGFILPEDEIGYLVLHFEASKERIQKEDGKHKKAIVVCSMGIGMSQLLTTKLERKFHSLDILKCVSLEEMEEVVRVEKPDFIISTIALEEIDYPSITISPLFQKEEEEKIKKFIANFNVKENKFPILKKFLEKELILIKKEMTNPDEIIEELSQLLHDNGYVNSEYLKDAKEREDLSSTAIGAEIAIPHGHPKNVLKQGVALAILKHPVRWKNQLVSIVCMLAIKDSKDENIKKMFEEINFLGENQQIIDNWKNSSSIEEFYQSI